MLTMPSRIAAIMAAFKLSAGNMDARLKPWVLLAGLCLTLVPLVVFAVSVWRETPTTESVVIYALFVTLGVVLISLTRDSEPPKQ